MNPHDPCLIPFDVLPANVVMPEGFRFCTDGATDAISTIAAEQLQGYLQQQQDWNHNFGLPENGSGTVIGKMFGVLVVQTAQGDTGFLAAFSGKLAGGNHHARFVPPVFDSLADTGFLNDGMRELTRMNEDIRALEAAAGTDLRDIQLLKEARRNHSHALQQRLHDHYRFLNRAGETKNLRALFEAAGYKNPPAGAGECAAPKLLQYAFMHQLKPIELTEFWWGLSPKSATWKHRHFYPACDEKCRPILAHMLQGIDEG